VNFVHRKESHRFSIRFKCMFGLLNVAKRQIESVTCSRWQQFLLEKRNEKFEQKFSKFKRSAKRNFFHSARHAQSRQAEKFQSQIELWVAADVKHTETGAVKRRWKRLTITGRAAAGSISGVKFEGIHSTVILIESFSSKTLMGWLGLDPTSSLEILLKVKFPAFWLAELQTLVRAASSLRWHFGVKKASVAVSTEANTICHSLLK
jgi:hypothetical protein